MTRRSFFQALLGWLVVAETLRQGASVLGALLWPAPDQSLPEVHTYHDVPVTYERWEGVTIVEHYALK